MPPLTGTASTSPARADTGAMPHTTISSINTLCAINAGIQDIMSVVIPPSANAVMTVGEIRAGKEGSGNVIPASGYLAGTIRTFDEQVRSTIKDSLIQMAENTAAARGGNGTGVLQPQRADRPQ